MEVKIVTYTVNPEEAIERAGKTCYKSYENINADSKDTFIKNIIKRGHESVLEHASITFNVKGVSRSLTHQLVRHRTFKFSQESQRYVNQEMFQYVTPDSIRNDVKGFTKYVGLMEQINDIYKEMVDCGIKPEDARFILPNACTSEITFTADFRNLRHFLGLRLDSHAQWEIRELANVILSKVKEIAPSVFEDIQ